MRKTMQRIFCLLMLLLFACAAPALGQSRALLVACSDFLTQPDLGREISGNLHMIGSALLGASTPLAGLSVEDGTIGTVEALGASIHSAFADAKEDDLSILYLCTHGILSSADDGQAYLLLGDGRTESALSSADLYRQLAPIQGEKLLILDACFSGALLGRGEPDAIRLPGTRSEQTPLTSPFLADTSIHVLTSASGSESSWYYDSEGLKSGAVSYFASALSSGLGLYGDAEADVNGDGTVTLGELHRHLRAAVPSSTSQLLSAHPDALALPTARGAMLSRPLSGFSYGSALLTASDPTLDFSFTVTSETAVQYRLVEYEDGAWNWQESQTFLDGDAALPPGRHTRSLTLPTVKESDSGYLMLQIFSVSPSGLLLCAERLIAVQPVLENPALCIAAPARFPDPGTSEIPIDVTLGAPAEVTVTIRDAQGGFVRSLASSQCTRPADKDTLRLYWDGRGEDGNLLESGVYTIAAETFVGLRRIKTATEIELNAD